MSIIVKLVVLLVCFFGHGSSVHKHYVAETEGVRLYGHARPESSVFLKGGDFRMGVDDPTSKSGEYPVKHLTVRQFVIDRTPVTVRDFIDFKKFKGRYQTTAEQKGYSWVFYTHVSKMANRAENVTNPLKEPWWYAIRGANWDRFFGLASEKMRRLDYPVTHVSYVDAYAYCAWKGMRLPTEYEWEYAARGGENGMRYPWGDKFAKKRMNVWQGHFPVENKAWDGYEGLSPAKAFPPQNKYGLYDVVGNAWEWTSTNFDFNEAKPHMSSHDNNNPWEAKQLHVVKGGSFIDSWDGKVNYEARCAARAGFPTGYTAENVGFRCARSVKENDDDPDKKYIHGDHRHHLLEETYEYKQKQESIGRQFVENLKIAVSELRNKLQSNNARDEL